MDVVDDVVGAERPQQTVAPVLPLSLLESVRAHDRPGEILEDEDLATSLPRRLGLTGVIESQIQKYETARRRGRGVPVDEVADLIRLVLRRPDAEAIMREAGAQIGRREFARRSRHLARLIRLLPRSLRARSIRRALLRMLRQVVGRGQLEVEHQPLVVRITGGFAAGADFGARACAIYGGAIEELLTLITGARRTLRHARCSAYDDCCEWRED